MKTCLVTAPITTEFVELDELNSPAVRLAAAEPQLGILNLAAVLEARGTAPEIVDLDQAYLAFARASKIHRIDDFAKTAANLISAKAADLYGFSSICSSYPLTVRIARELKALRPSCTVLFGGPQASVVDLETLAAFPFVDLVLRGEAEASLPLLLDELRGEALLERVQGLTYRAEGTLRRNVPSPLLTDLDALPTPAYHLTGILNNAVSASLELGRGCPFACTFCSTNDFFRRNFRLHTPERMLRDMRALEARHGIRSFVLVHDMFTVDRRKVSAFCDAMIGSGDEFTWSCSARTDCVDEELLALMARAGCRGVFFGIEVGSTRMQKVIEKHLDPLRAEEIIDAAERLGIRTTVSLITGFPEETWDDVRDTMRIFTHSARCPQSSPQLNILAPLADTPLYTKYKEQLTLEELCSDMSHQGGSQREADLALIKEHPQIFPNFYLLPMQHLDRECLFELREFLLIGTGRFRWLLGAIDQCADGLLDAFLAWRNYRLKLQPQLRGPALRRYYKMKDFRLNFVQFVKEDAARKSTVVQALLECEEAVQLRSAAKYAQVSGRVLPRGATLRSKDVPVRTRNARVIELGCDVQKIVEGIKQCTEPQWVYGPHFYITQETPEGFDRLLRISKWLAALLKACDGRRNLEATKRRLSSQLVDVKPTMRTYVASRLIEGAHIRGHIQIYRQTRHTTTEIPTKLVLRNSHHSVRNDLSR